MQENQNNRSQSAKKMDGKQRQEIALQAMQQEKSMAEISNENNVSRTFIHRQKNKAKQAINDAFDPTNKNADVLFHIPVTKSFLTRLILCLELHCRGSFRGIQKTVDDLFDYKISIGNIHNISKDAANKAKQINGKQDLSAIKESSYDELFHLRSPPSFLVLIFVHCIVHSWLQWITVMKIPGEFIYLICKHKDLLQKERLPIMEKVFVLDIILSIRIRRVMETIFILVKHCWN
jgi:hypothetical protein